MCGEMFNCSRTEVLKGTNTGLSSESSFAVRRDTPLI